MLAQFPWNTGYRGNCKLGVTKLQGARWPGEDKTKQLQKNTWRQHLLIAVFVVV